MNADDFIKRAEVRNVIRDLKETCKDKVFSDIVDANGNQYVDLVMEGGGVLGIALVGYTYVLEEMGIRFLRIGGTSAGSINAMLLAGLGTPEERKSTKIIEALAQLNMYDFIDGDDDVKDLVKTIVQEAGKFKLGWKSVQVWDNLEECLGLNPGHAFTQWMAKILKEAGIETTQQLEQQMATLPAGLHGRDGQEINKENTNASLALVAADITTETKVQFPKMAPLYWEDPANVNPALYVRASMSIPFFFEPLRIENIPTGEKAWENWEKLAGYTEDLPKTCMLVDGGVMSNFPIDLFHKPTRTPSAPTFGAKLGSDHRQHRKIEKPTNLLNAVFNAARHCLDYDFIVRNPDYRKLVTYIDTGEYYWLDFEMTEESKHDLFQRGAKAAHDFLIKFEWASYKETRRQLAAAYKS